MAEKKKTDPRSSVNGKTFTWHPDVADGEDLLPDLVLPLRLKLKHLRLTGSSNLDTVAQAELMEAIAPSVGDTLEEMDANDINACFEAWQSAYTELAGATPGE